MWIDLLGLNVGDPSGCAFTVISTSAETAAPLLSVTVNRYRYTPWIRPDTVVVREVGEAMFVTGPLTLSQSILVIVPSASPAVPDKSILFVGRNIVWLLPADTVGA